MICKTLHSVVLGCMLFLNAACQKNAHIVTVDYKQDFLLDTTVAIRTYVIGGTIIQPNQIKRIGDRILVFGGYHEVGIYSYPELDFISKTTLPAAASTTLGNGCLYREKEGYVDTYVLRDDSLYKTSSFVIAKTPNTIGTVQELNPGVYVYPDKSDFPGMYEFHIMDINHRKCISKGNYPEDDRRFKKLRDFKLAYGHSINVKPDKSAFIVTYGALSRIRIYDGDGELQHDVFIEGSLGNYKVVPTRASEQYWHFSNTISTDKYVYILNPDELGIAPLVPRSNILVLDWQGNLIAKYRFNALVYSFFIDEQRNVICGSCWEEGKGMVFFTTNILNH